MGACGVGDGGQPWDRGGHSAAAGAPLGDSSWSDSSWSRRLHVGPFHKLAALRFSALLNQESPVVEPTLM